MDVELECRGNHNARLDGVQSISTVRDECGVEAVFERMVRSEDVFLSYLIPPWRAVSSGQLFRAAHLRQVGVGLRPGIQEFRVRNTRLVVFTESMLRLHQTEIGASAAGIAFERGAEKLFGLFPSFQLKADLSGDLLHRNWVKRRFRIAELDLLFDPRTQ